MQIDAEAGTHRPDADAMLLSCLLCKQYKQ